MKKLTMYRLRCTFADTVNKSDVYTGFVDDLKALEFAQAYIDSSNLYISVDVETVRRYRFTYIACRYVGTVYKR